MTNKDNSTSNNPAHIVPNRETSARAFAESEARQSEAILRSEALAALGDEMIRQDFARSDKFSGELRLGAAKAFAILHPQPLKHAVSPLGSIQGEHREARRSLLQVSVLLLTWSLMQGRQAQNAFLSISETLAAQAATETDPKLKQRILKLSEKMASDAATCEPRNRELENRLLIRSKALASLDASSAETFLRRPATV